MSAYVDRKASKLWRKFCSEFSIEISLVAENWKLLLTGIAFQWTFHPFIFQNKNIYTALIWCRVLAYLVYIKVMSERCEKLDEVLVPIIQHSLKSKESKSCGPGLLVNNWLFQYELAFLFVGEELAGILSRKEDCCVAFGWCILVRNLVEDERFMAQFTLHGIRDNYSAFLKILSKCILQLSCIVCTGRFEHPIQFSVPTL